MVTITDHKLKSLKPADKPLFVRDKKLRGFGVKVNPSGSIKFIVEAWSQGKSYRKTIGSYPILDTKKAREQALSYLTQIKTGEYERQSHTQTTLCTLLDKYLKHVDLKPRTKQDYLTAINCYIPDWQERTINSITKEMIETRFFLIRDQGFNGGRPTYSQATKTMRILSALMNYAMADDLIQSNPVDVLKQKRIDRSIKKREVYLPASKARELLDYSTSESHPATLAVHLMLFTGLRKNEAFRLTWSDLEAVEDIQCIVVRDTKNHRPHYVPITEDIQQILDRATNSSQYIFPSTQKKNSPISDVRPTLKRLSKLIDMEFKCHDLRRTFATRASEVGIDYLTIKRLLNHRSNDITAQYIQWNSRANLLVMKDALERVQF